MRDGVPGVFPGVSREQVDAVLEHTERSLVKRESVPKTEDGHADSF